MTFTNHNNDIWIPAIIVSYTSFGRGEFGLNFGFTKSGTHCTDLLKNMKYPFLEEAKDFSDEPHIQMEFCHFPC